MRQLVTRHGVENHAGQMLAQVTLHRLRTHVDRQGGLITSAQARAFVVLDEIAAPDGRRLRSARRSG
jgi:hypothetical protein